MDKLLIISGPTGSGKTSLAVALAQQFNGQIISADSRQIYQGLDIGTGKDHPKDISIEMIDIISPDRLFSVADYQTQALKLITEIQKRGRLPIVVGGTMQYIQSLINPHTDTFSVKPNPALRLVLNRLPVPVLRFLLKLIHPSLYNRLNNSDIHNPRRLVRKIEIRLSASRPSRESPTRLDYLHLSLTATNDILYRRIDDRVTARLDAGLLQEIKTLLKKYTWSDPGLNTLAYKQFKTYFDRSSPSILKQSIEKWKFDEHAYARRQKTWLKKMPQVNFFDITQPGYDKEVVNLVSNYLGRS